MYNVLRIHQQQKEVSKSAKKTIPEKLQLQYIELRCCDGRTVSFLNFALGLEERAWVFRRVLSVHGPADERTC